MLHYLLVICVTAEISSGSLRFMPVQALARGKPFNGYSEKPTHFSRLLRLAWGYRGPLLVVNPRFPTGWSKRSHLLPLFKCMHFYAIQQTCIISNVCIIRKTKNQGVFVKHYSITGGRRMLVTAFTSIQDGARRIRSKLPGLISRRIGLKMVNFYE